MKDLDNFLTPLKNVIRSRLIPVLAIWDGRNNRNNNTERRGIINVNEKLSTDTKLAVKHCHCIVEQSEEPVEFESSAKLIRRKKKKRQKHHYEKSNKQEKEFYDAMTSAWGMDGQWRS